MYIHTYKAKWAPDSRPVLAGLVLSWLITIDPDLLNISESENHGLRFYNNNNNNNQNHRTAGFQSLKKHERADK